MLTCKQAEKMVMPYINDELEDADLEDYLLHIRSCKDCLEELEITYTIHTGLLQLDEETDDEGIYKGITDSLNRSWLRIRSKKLRDVICSVVDTLAVTGVVVILIMQIGIWIH